MTNLFQKIRRDAAKNDRSEAISRAGKMPNAAARPSQDNPCAKHKCFHGIACRMLALTASVVLASTVGLLPAGAHYVKPPGDKEAAPAIVQVRIAFGFGVTIFDPTRNHHQSYVVNVAGPLGTGMVVNAGGAVLTTEATAFPKEDGARVEAVNTAFNKFHPSGWSAHAQLAAKHNLADPAWNKVLQQCYSGGPQCEVTPQGRSREIAFNTVPAKRLGVSGRVRIAGGLAMLLTGSDPSSTPTVDFSTQLPRSSPYIAMGYNTSGQLARSSGALTNGALEPAKVRDISTKFANNGDGVTLIDPASKGSVIAVLVGSGSTLRPVSPTLPMLTAGYRLERGAFDTDIDQALGYFTGKHYGHAFPLLEGVTQVLPDRELLADLAFARTWRGTSKDESESASMSPSAPPKRISLWTGGVSAVAAVGAVVGLLAWRRRGRGSETVADDLADDAPLGSEDDADDIYGDEVVGASTSQRADSAGSMSHDWPDSEGTGSQRSESSTPVLYAPSTGAPHAGQFCPACGVGLIAGDRYCYHCGTPAR